MTSFEDFRKSRSHHPTSIAAEERMVVHHFESNHSRSKEGRFIVPLPKNPNARSIGESRSRAVKRFMSLERSLNAKGCFKEFNAVMQEYLDSGHAETIPLLDLEKPPDFTFYLPMHAVHKHPVARRRSELSLMRRQNPLLECPSTTSYLLARPYIRH